jgi:ABC-type nickel/cobalt efflux system permease component RcnA
MSFLAAFVALVPFANPATADEGTLVHWDALAPSVEPFEDPFLEMSIEQKSDLRDVLLSREAAAKGHTEPALSGRASEALKRLNAAGLDADYLLEQRLVVMEHRREEATGVTSDFLGGDVLIDGFVLPLSWEGEQVVEFLLVPWVGACIHTPPPPPNQIIHVDFPDGLELSKRFEAVRLSGTLQHEAAEHELFLIDGSRTIPASYTLRGAAISGTPGAVQAASATDVPFVTRLQIWANTLLTSGMSGMGQNASSKALATALFVAFAYGVLHTLGPGHGKALVVSYFVGTGGSLRRGLTMGTRIAVFHVLSALLVVFLFDFAVRQSTGDAPSDYRQIRLASYALIVTIGMVMLWRAFRAFRVDAGHTAENDLHAHDHGHQGHMHSGCAACAANAAPKNGGWIAAAIGAVPCTGALLVMLFGLANDLVLPAVMMVVAISVGMALAMSAIGVAALWGRDWAEARWASDARRRLRFERWTRVSGAVCVFAIGVGLFTLTVMHPSGPEQTPTEITLRAEADLDADG